MNFGELSRDRPEVELVNKSLMISSSFSILSNWRYVEGNEASVRQRE